MVQTIDKQCPSEGGVAVYQARVMLNYFYNDVDYADWCENIFPENIERREVIEQISATTVNVYPNPTNGSCLVKYEGLPVNSIFEITDITGKVLIEKTVTDVTGMFDINLVDYSNGIYLYNVKGDCCNTLNGKIILVK